MAQPYTDRYVAFIDVLGFRQIVENFGKREFPGPLDTRNLLRVVHERPGPEIAEFKESADFRVQSIPTRLPFRLHSRPKVWTISFSRSDSWRFSFYSKAF